MPDSTHHTVPEDIREFFKISEVEADAPFYYLWVYDPTSGEVIVTHNHEVDEIDTHTHEDLAALVPHPNRIHGYAYRIGGGFRITDWEHKPVADPFVKRQVVKSLSQVSKTARTHDPREGQ